MEQIKKKWNPAYLKLQGEIIKQVFEFYNVPVRIFKDGGAAIDMEKVMDNPNFADKFSPFMKDLKNFVSKYIPIEKQSEI